MWTDQRSSIQPSNVQYILVYALQRNQHHPDQLLRHMSSNARCATSLYRIWRPCPYGNRCNMEEHHRKRNVWKREAQRQREILLQQKVTKEALKVATKEIKARTRANLNEHITKAKERASLTEHAITTATQANLRAHLIDIWESWTRVFSKGCINHGLSQLLGKRFTELLRMESIHIE